MYVVVRIENQYDQFGSYFVGVYDVESACVSPNNHFGRQNNEDIWYEKHPINWNTNYGEDSYVHDSVEYRNHQTIRPLEKRGKTTSISKSVLAVDRQSQ